MAEAGLGTALIFTGLGMRASRQQEKLDQSRIGFETESAQLASSEQAYESTKNFNQAVGTQIALAGARGGTGSSALRQFSMESYSNYLSDQSAIKRTGRAAAIGGTLQKAQSKGDRYARDLKLLAGLGSSVADSYNLNTASKAAGKV